ncbi:hypothetical protein [Actinomadura luteofluorescens]|uniref:hypothetical protein n=1 Tax=Actinomadura luteofluorescens TaxID=46163 RepID=UPI0030D20549
MSVRADLHVLWPSPYFPEIAAPAPWTVTSRSFAPEALTSIVPSGLTWAVPFAGVIVTVVSDPPEASLPSPPIEQPVTSSASAPVPPATTGPNRPFVTTDSPNLKHSPRVGEIYLRMETP